VLAGFAGAISVLGWSGSVLAEGPEEGANDGEPAAERSYSLDRYASLWEKSLFFSTAPAVVADAAFARNYTLAGVFEMNGATTAALVNKRDQSVVSISDQSSEGGMRLLAVESAGDPAQARVQVEKAGQRAWIAVAPSATTASSQASPRPGMPIDRKLVPAQEAVPESSMSLENFPKPVAPQIAPKSAKDPVKPEFSREGAPPPPPMPPSPLDAAMATEEEIIVPIPDGE